MSRRTKFIPHQILSSLVIWTTTLTPGCSSAPDVKPSAKASNPSQPQEAPAASNPPPSATFAQANTATSINDACDGASDAVALAETSTDRSTDPSTTSAASSASTSLTTIPTIYPASDPSALFTIDAMVGQANGQPIYAARVFEPIEEQLIALGQTHPPAQFRFQARQLIQGQLGQIVLESLMLGEAERDLSAQEQAGLDYILNGRREELIRFWGSGSVAVAESRLIEETSLDLKQTLEQERQKMVIQRYMHQKLYPKIHVSRKDIERYYQDHQSEYNPPIKRILRLIRIASTAEADRVDQALQEGQPFDQVASRSKNRYRPQEGGLMSEKAVGDEVFGQPQLNEAMRSLKAEQHSPRIQIDDAYWWLAVDEIDEGSGKSLRDAQQEIEQLLRRQQFQTLTQRYRQQLVASGSYNPIEEMSDALIEVAMSRYAQARDPTAAAE